VHRALEPENAPARLLGRLLLFIDIRRDTQLLFVEAGVPLV